MFFAMVAFFPWSQINDVFLIRIPNIFLVAQAHVFLQFFLFYVSVLYISWKKNHSRVGRSGFFFSMLLIACFGIARNFFIMFLTHSSSECFLCLLYDLFCDEPVSFCDNFLLQFSFSELSITSGLFSSKIKPCYNLLKFCSHFTIAIFFFCAFVLIGRSIV